VAPGSPHTRTAPQVERPTGERQDEGDVICGLCGARNSANRNFCRRCGASLLQAVVEEPKRRPWWRRYLSTQRRLAAGERPASRGSVGRILGRAIRITAILAIGAVLASIVLTYSLTPTVRNGVNRRAHDTYVSAQRRFNIGSPVAVRPVRIAASSSALGRPPSNLIDLVPDDYWAADLGLDPQPELQISFGTATDLDDIVVISGAGNDFATVGRPKDVLITYSDRSQERLTLLDEPKSHKYELHANRITSLTIRIRSVYPAEQSTVVGISEIEFFRLQSPLPLGP
jgi:ribosomal protein L40E